MDAEFAKQQLCKLAGDLLNAISVPSLMERHSDQIKQIESRVKQHQNPERSPIVLSLGKSADVMASEFVSRCTSLDWQGIVCSPYPSEAKQVSGLRYFRGGHPLPNADSIQSALRCRDMLQDLQADDVVVYLISGGASAAFTLPDERIELFDLQSTYQMLVRSQANIREINTIRIALSRVKGGRLAAIAQPARQYSIVISDVPGDDLRWVSSGPSVPAGDDLDDPIELLKRFELWDHAPDSVRTVLQQPAETKQFSSDVETAPICIGSNKIAIETTANLAKEIGWNTVIEDQFNESPVAIAARGLIERLRKLSTDDGPACVVAGGEVLVEVLGSGQGGRNQAFILECLGLIDGENIAVLSLGTDGIDGNSDAAGAVGNGESYSRCHALGIAIDIIEQESNSNKLFERLGDLVVTGPTLNNLRDIRVLIAW